MERLQKLCWAPISLLAGAILMKFEFCSNVRILLSGIFQSMVMSVSSGRLRSLKMKASLLPMAPDFYRFKSYGK